MSDIIIAPMNNRDCPRHMCITGPLFRAQGLSATSVDSQEEKSSINVFSKEMGYEKMIVCEAVFLSGLVEGTPRDIGSRIMDYDELLTVVDKIKLPYTWMGVNSISRSYHIERESILSVIKTLGSDDVHFFIGIYFVNPESFPKLFKKLFDIRKEKESNRKKQREKFRENQPITKNVGYKHNPVEIEKAIAKSIGLFTTEEGAYSAGLKLETFRNYMHGGLISAKKVATGRCNFYSKEDIEKLKQIIKGYSTNHAAIRIGVGRKRLEKWMKEGSIPYVRVGTTRKVFISFDAVEKLRKLYRPGQKIDTIPTEKTSLEA